MSGSKPRPDAKLTDDTTRPSPAPPGLVFKPDVRQVVRVARVRTYTLLATFVLLLVGLVLILTYRPPPPPQVDSVGSTRALPPTESVVRAVRSTTSQPVPASPRVGAAEAALSASATLEGLARRAAEKWQRASDLSPQGTVTPDDAERAVEKLRMAAVLADSASQDIVLARQQAEVVLRASREAGPSDAFRIGVLYAAIDRHLKSLAEDAADRLAYYQKSEASVEALLRWDQAEQEIQQNVAVSHLRRSEERQPSLQRLSQQVREAMHNVEKAGE